MVRLQGEKIYLATMEREHCKKVWDDKEHDWNLRVEPFIIGLSSVNSDKWFEDIQKSQGKDSLYLGIFLPDGTIIGDIVLGDLNWKSRSCSIGYGLSKIEYYNKGYITDAVKVIINYAFCYLGFERISSSTQDFNIGSQRVLEKCGFSLEGRERKAGYLYGKKYDKLNYGLLIEEYNIF